MWTCFLVRTVLIVCSLLFSIHGNNDDSIAQNTFVDYVGVVPSLFVDKAAVANPPAKFPNLAYLGQLPTFQNALLSQLYQKWNTTSIDMITTSEVAVSVTIDNTSHLNEIVKELKEFCSVDVDSDLTIVCVVGSLTAEKHGYALKILDALKNIPLRMISYGGSEYNVSVVIDSKHKKDALIALNKGLF